MQLAARGFRITPVPIRQLGLRPARATRLRSEPPAGVRWVHGGRQLMREPLGGITVQVRTQPLEDAEFERHLAVIYDLCLEFDPRELDVSYGWACDLEIDKLWKCHRIETSELPSFINRSVAKGILRLGDSDLHVKGVHTTFSFTLCHEADVHFESSDPSLVARVTDAWSGHGLSYYEVP